jgi:hypothetical protein
MSCVLLRNVCNSRKGHEMLSSNLHFGLIQKVVDQQGKPFQGTKKQIQDVVNQQASKPKWT